MDPVMILSTGSVTESCVILLYCVISIVALFMCLPPSLPFFFSALVFIAVWFRLEAELFMTVSVLGVRSALLGLKLFRYLYSIGKVGFKEVGTGKSWDGRLGYNWKHILESDLQGLSHFEFLTPPYAVGLSIEHWTSATYCLDLQHLVSFLFWFCLQCLNLWWAPIHFSCALFWIGGKKKRKKKWLQASVHLSAASWSPSSTAGQLYYPPLIYSGRELRWMLPSPHHWHMHTADRAMNCRSLYSAVTASLWQRNW